MMRMRKAPRLLFGFSCEGANGETGEIEGCPKGIGGAGELRRARERGSEGACDLRLNFDSCTLVIVCENSMRSDI